MNFFVSFYSEQVCSEGCCHLSCLSWFKRERNAFFALKGYLLPAIRIVSSLHGDNSFPLMEIISVTRGDDLNGAWKLSLSTKGMLSLISANKRLTENKGGSPLRAPCFSNLTK